MNAHWGSGCIAPRILNRGDRWRWVVSFNVPAALPLLWETRYPLYRRLGEPQIRSKRGGEEKNIPPLSLPEIKPWSFGPYSSLYTDSTASKERPLGRPKFRWSDNIKTHLEK